jgi:uncharacterized protein (DUF488 family)
MASPLISVGYEGRDVEGLVASLTQQRVAVLVDVRLTPLSRKPGLSKKRLASTLAEHGIDYLHLPALGNPKDNRAALRAGKPCSRDRFTALLQGSAGAHALRHVAELLDDQTVALLCFERSHEECHRQLVVEELRRTIPALRLVTV